MSTYTPKRSRRGLRMVIALALATTAAGGVFIYASSVQRQVAQQPQVRQEASVEPTQTTLVSVVVAHVDLQAKTRLTPDAFELRDLPAGAVSSNALKSLDAVAGKVLNAPMAAGEQLTSSRLMEPPAADIKTIADMIPAGLRAMSLALTELDGAGGLIVPGQRVDVVAVFKKDTLGKDESMIVLQDVLVLAVAQATSADQLLATPTTIPAAPTPRAVAQVAPAPALGVGSTSRPTPAAAATAIPTQAQVFNPATNSVTDRLPAAPPQAKTVTLAVAPEAVERLALAKDYGHLSYVIRPTSERTQQSLVPADLGTLANPIEATAAEILATEISPTNVKVGDTVTVKITIRNTSDKPLQTMGPQPGFTYVQGQTYFTQQFASQPGKWRVAIGSAGLDSTELPYRWGLGADLAPGASTTVTGQIKVTADFKATNFWAAIVEEPAKIVQNGVGITLITAMPENVAVVAVDSANARSGPSVASSVVDQIPYGTQIEIVGQSADWFKVKLPDQRVAWMAAGWIVVPGR
jgi:Flp pilus assembly protein CpaB